MTTINIEDNIYRNWVKFYNKHNKLEYPTLRNFTAKKLKEMMEKQNERN